jgi:hypothetical protein
VTGPKGYQGDQGNQGATGPTGVTGPYNTPILYTGSIGFTGLTGTNYIVSSSLTSSVLSSKKIVIQGYSTTSFANIAAVLEVYPISSGGYWNITMTVKGDGTIDTATYIVYYYGLN